MTDQGHLLLQAILDDPGDDFRRLVYADWLEENGDEDRAEFIRLQVELPAIRKAEKKAKAVQQEQRILKQHGRVWTESIMPAEAEYLHPYKFQPCHAWQTYIDGFIGAVCIEFRRGFVSWVQCWSSYWFANYESIFSKHPIEEVTLTDTPYLVWLNGKVVLGDRPEGASRPFRYEDSTNEEKALVAAKQLMEDTFPGICFHLN